jgi:hypothetical protein
MIFYKEHYLLAWPAKGYGVYDNNFQPSSFLGIESQQMRDIKVTAWALGSEDILWCGTDGNGIIKISPRTKSFGKAFAIYLKMIPLESRASMILRLTMGLCSKRI